MLLLSPEVFVDSIRVPVCKRCDNQRAVSKCHMRCHRVWADHTVTPGGFRSDCTVFGIFNDKCFRRHDSEELARFFKDVWVRFPPIWADIVACCKHVEVCFDAKAFRMCVYPNPG